jgi:hypothetical protein
LDSLKQPITHDNYIQFDELKEYQYLDKSDLEVMNYKEFRSPGLTMYEISTKEKNLRSGAEGESYLRGYYYLIAGSEEIQKWSSAKLKTLLKCLKP